MKSVTVHRFERYAVIREDCEMVSLTDVIPLLEALEDIANEDYRGPRPISAMLAFKALEPWREVLEKMK